MCPVMAVVPAGSDLIGSPSARERPQQQRRAATAGRFARAVCGRALGGVVRRIYRLRQRGWVPTRGIPRPTPAGATAKQPAMSVSWTDAKAYVGWLSRKTARDLPAALRGRVGICHTGCAKVCKSTPFWFGDGMSKARANYNWRIAYIGGRKGDPADAHGSDRQPPRPIGSACSCAWQRQRVGRGLLGRDASGMPREVRRGPRECRRRVVRGGLEGRAQRTSGRPSGLGTRAERRARRFPGCPGAENVGVLPAKFWACRTLPKSRRNGILLP